MNIKSQINCYPLNLILIMLSSPNAKYETFYQFEPKNQWLIEEEEKSIKVSWSKEKGNSKITLMDGWMDGTLKNLSNIIVIPPQSLFRSIIWT